MAAFILSRVSAAYMSEREPRIESTGQRVAAGGRVTAIPPRHVTRVSVPVPSHPAAFEFRLDWEGTGPDFPELKAFDLVQGQTRSDPLGVGT